jgi:hypothetical protein
MQFKCEAANSAYREIVQHTGKVVSDLESQAMKLTDSQERMQLMAQAKSISIHGLSTAIQTAHHIDMQAAGLVAGVAVMTNGK